MTIDIGLMASRPAAPSGDTAVVMPPQEAGVLPNTVAALFGDVLRRVVAMPAGVPAAVVAVPVEAADAALASPTEEDVDTDTDAALLTGTEAACAQLPSQSALAAALHAVAGAPAITTRDAGNQTKGAAPATAISAPAAGSPDTDAALAAPARREIAGDALAQAAGGARSTGATAAMQPALERAAPTDAVDGGVPAIVTNTVSQDARAHHAATTAGDAVVKLAHASPESWQKPLTEALGERLQVQLGKLGERAVIRLDPPMLGRVEIIVQHDAGGALQVHLSASNSEVLRQLHTMGDSLRDALGQRQGADVTVVVADAGRDAEGRQRSGQQQGREEERPGDALDEAQHGFLASRFALPTDGN
jgi:flagellar hook-length control protein FliK